MPAALSVRVHDLDQTQALAAALARTLRPGDVICLDGELGAGKTAFVTALAAAFGIVGEITSPTFTLENRHRVPGEGPITLLVHCDLYRPGEDARRDLLPAMLEARDEGALLAIEWADPVKDWLTPYLQLTVELVPGGEGDRRFTLRPVPFGWPPLGRLAAEWERVAVVEEWR